MNLLRRTRAPLEEIGSPLSIPTVHGYPLREYPEEAVSKLRPMMTRLLHKGGLPKRLAFASALRSEGVSFTAQALAGIIAHDLSYRVCIVDLNFWWPDSCLKAASVYDQSLASVLLNETPLENAVTPTAWPNLSFLPAGEIPRHMRSMVAHSQALRDVIERLSADFDHLILDVPAILATTEAAALASLAHATCLVIRQGVSHTEDVARALDEVEHLEIIGVVMNSVKYSAPSRLLKVMMF